MTTPLRLVLTEQSGLELSVEYTFQNGQFNHVIELRREAELLDRWNEQPASAEDWPCSPPIQQLSLESIEGVPTLLGVGQAGRSHWSLSVQPQPASETQAAGFCFDIACRCKGTPQWLGSTYEQSILPQSVSAGIQFEAELGVMQIQRSHCRIECPVDANEPHPATQRWCYWVRMPR